MDLSKIKSLVIQDATLSGWDENELFECKLRKPGIYNMAASGAIPNPLLSTIEAMFSGDEKRIQKHNIVEQAKALKAMAKSALIEPTMAELEAEQIELTDDQLLEIYAFCMRGVQGLADFRAATRSAISAYVQAVQNSSEPTATD